MPDNQEQSALEATSAAIKRGVETATDATQNALETASDATQFAIDATAESVKKGSENINRIQE
ncbi:hypothetical protein FB479_11051 [Brevibacillus sp. AG162]|uniref:hypothetical protein n=1 Tax=Brevibacillus sp. AG162 TaxID=2572910 RepID=UPI0011530665|nr:hypothetical protein [Brevibacillus sp. AG162]TQK53414.1 hypothetical protein FB479_11051 [Brevibacillus sp. AG162]